MTGSKVKVDKLSRISVSETNSDILISDKKIEQINLKIHFSKEQDCLKDGTGQHQ